MNISVIIPTNNKTSRIKLMLESLFKQLDEVDKSEAIFINDGSSQNIDFIFDNIKGKSNIRYYKSENKGRAHARNLGIEYARYDTLVFVDDDVLLAPDFLYQHIESQKTEPKVLHGEIKNFVYSYPFEHIENGILYEQEQGLMKRGKYVTYLKEKCQSLKDIDNYKKIYNQSKYMLLESRIIDIYNKKIEELEWISFTGGNVSCPKKWIQEINGFDENFGIHWGCEDLELGYRLKKLNRTFGYNSKASCCHMDHIKRHAREDHKITKDYFYEKHRDKQIIELDNYLFAKGILL